MAGGIVMELRAENFAKISQADIAVDGITVIAGENDTWKNKYMWFEWIVEMITRQEWKLGSKDIFYEIVSSISSWI